MNQMLWTQRANFGPSGRSTTAMAFDVSRKCTVLFGGYASSSNAVLSDTWQWDGSAWVQISDMGPLVPAFAMAYLTGRSQMMLLAATVSQTGHLYPSQTWIWNQQGWTQVDELGPANPSMCAYDQSRDRVVVLTTDYAEAGQTWEWDGNSWTQVEDSGPSPRYGGSLAYDSGNKQVVLLGGLSLTDQPLGDTWGWDGTTWRQLAAFGPPPRSAAGIAYDASRKCVVLFGGLGGRPEDGTLAPPDTWEWDGKRWTQRQDMGPTNRLAPAMAFDSQRNLVVLFGGSTGSTETWEYAPWPSP